MGAIPGDPGVEHDAGQVDAGVRVLGQQPVQQVLQRPRHAGGFWQHQLLRLDLLIQCQRAVRLEGHRACAVVVIRYVSDRHPGKQSTLPSR